MVSKLHPNDRPRSQNFSLSDNFLHDFIFEGRYFGGLSRNDFIKLLFLHFKNNKNDKKYTTDLKGMIPKAIGEDVKINANNTNSNGSSLISSNNKKGNKGNKQEVNYE